MRKLLKLLVFIVIPALLVNAWLVSRQTREAATFGGGRVVSITGPDLNVREYGADSGDGAIVLLHGYASSIEWWADVAPQLAEKTGRKVVAIDLVGHGGSESPLDSDAYGAEGQSVTVARALAEAKVDAERMLIATHSAPAAMLQATPTSPWQPTSAPEMLAFSL